MLVYQRVHGNNINTWFVNLSGLRAWGVWWLAVVWINSLPSFRMFCWRWSCSVWFAPCQEKHFPGKDGEQWGGFQFLAALPTSRAPQNFDSGGCGECRSGRVSSLVHMHAQRKHVSSAWHAVLTIQMHLEHSLHAVFSIHFQYYIQYSMDFDENAPGNPGTWDVWSAWSAQVMVGLFLKAQKMTPSTPETFRLTKKRRIANCAEESPGWDSLDILSAFLGFEMCWVARRQESTFTRCQHWKVWKALFKAMVWIYYGLS